MAVRLLCGALVLGAGLSAAGCNIGPSGDRLYVSYWKAGKDHPIQIVKGWKYKGEHWERVVHVDVKTPKKDIFSDMEK